MKFLSSAGLFALMVEVVIAVPHPVAKPAPVAQPQLFLTLLGDQPETVIIYPHGGGAATPISLVVGPTGITTATPTPLSVNPGGPFKNATDPPSVPLATAPLVTAPHVVVPLTTAASASLPTIAASSAKNLSVSLAYPTFTSTLPVSVFSTGTGPLAPITTGLLTPISPLLPGNVIINLLIARLTEILNAEAALFSEVELLLSDLKLSVAVVNNKRDFHKRVDGHHAH